MVLAFTPLLVLTLVVAALRCGSRESESTLREQILAAALIVGAWIALGTEILSSLRLITTGGVTGFWLFATAVAAAGLVWRCQRSGPPVPLRIPGLDAIDAVLTSGIVATALVILVVAWLAPPQSSDSLGYHMSRVMHWTQNRSVAPYPTYDARQLFQPPFAEMVRLHLQLLTGSDQAGCLLQWFGCMGALAAASLVARDLGGRVRAQIFAAAFTLTMPMGLTQATAGKNGWVETLWLLALVHFCITAAWNSPRPPKPGEVVAAFAALGLALMTKVTSWFFAFPFVLLTLLPVFRISSSARRHLVAPVAIGIALVCAINAPYLARNVSIYGNPVAGPATLSKNGLGFVTPGIVVSNALRNAAAQFGTQSASFNETMLGWVVGAHRWIGVDPFDRRISQFDRFKIAPPSRVEEFAFSPLHILLVCAAGAAVLASRRLRAQRSMLSYLAALGSGYLLFCATIKWQGPNARLLMPLLVLAGPFVAVVAGDLFRGRVAPAVAAVLFVACVPYATDTYGRPLSLEPGESVLFTPRSDLYFKRFWQVRRTYDEVARVVKRSHTRNLGVVFTNTGQPEYLLWVLLKDADPGLRIEHVSVTDASGQLYRKPPWRDFQPDLVVVFMTGRSTRFFNPKDIGAGRSVKFVHSYGSARFYEPVVESRAE